MSKEPSKCTHNGTSSISELFCSKCGVFAHKAVYGIKPVKYNTPVDICPIETFRFMQNEINLQKTEQLTATPKKNSTYSNRRDEFFKLIKNIVRKLRFDSNTLHLAYYYLDIVQLRNPELKADLSTVICLFIAAKFFEINPYYEFFNDYRNFNRVFPYTMEEMRDLEIKIIQTLGYRLKYYTPYDVLKMFFSYGIVFNNDVFGNETIGLCLTPLKGGKNESLDFKNYGIVEEIYLFCEAMLSLCLEDSNYLNYSTEQIACACVMLLRTLLRLKDAWSKIYVDVLGVSKEDFSGAYSFVKKNFLAKRAIFDEKIKLNYFVLKENEIKCSFKDIQSIKINITSNPIVQKTNLTSNIPICQTPASEIDKSDRVEKMDKSEQKLTKTLRDSYARANSLSTKTSYLKNRLNSSKSKEKNVKPLNNLIYGYSKKEETIFKPSIKAPATTSTTNNSTAEKSVERVNTAGNSILRLNLKNLKIPNENSSNQDSRRDQGNSSRERIPTTTNNIRSNFHHNTLKQQLNFTNTNNYSIKEEIHDGSANGLDGKAKVASICSQIKINQNRSNKKKVTTKLTYVNTKQILNTISGVSSGSTLNSNFNQNNGGGLINKKTSLVIDNSDLTPEGESLKSSNLTTRNENKVSINYNMDNTVEIASNVSSKQQKFAKNLNNLHPSNMSGNVLSSKKILKVEKKKSTNLSEYNSLNRLITTKPSQSKQSLSIVTNGATTTIATNNQSSGVKVANIDFHKIHSVNLKK